MVEELKMAKKYIEERVLYAYTLQALCVQRDWYNRGNNEEYENLFSRLYENGCSANITTEKLAEIAEDIIEHTEEEHDIEDVMFAIAKECVSYFCEA
jgi:hypothetical protein